MARSGAPRLRACQGALLGLLVLIALFGTCLAQKHIPKDPVGHKGGPQRIATTPGHVPDPTFAPAFHARGLQAHHPVAGTGKLIVGTISGQIYYIDKESGREVWSFASGAPLFRSSYQPIIPSLNGSIYLYSETGLKKHPLSVRDIVAHAPFSPGDGNIYLGSKQSHLFAIDPESGNVYDCHSGTNSNRTVDCNGEARLPHPSTSSANNSVQLPKGVVFLGRADYFIHAMDERTGVERWNMSLGEFVSSARDFSLLPAETSLISSVDGSLKLVDTASGDTLWSITLPSPAIHIQSDSSEGPPPPLIFQEQAGLYLSGTSKVLVTHSDGALIAIERPSPAALPALPSSSDFPLLLDLPANPTDVVIIDEPDLLDPLDPIVDPTENHPLVRPGHCSPESPELCLLGLHNLVCERPNMIHDENGVCIDRDGPIRLLPSPVDYPAKPTEHPWYHFEMTSEKWTIVFGIVAAVAVLSNIVRFLVGILRGKPMTIPGGDPKPTTVKSPKKTKPKGSKKTKRDKEAAKEREGDKSTVPASPLVVEQKKAAVIGPDGKLRIGLIEMDPRIVLGYGSSGTVVYEGGLNGRKVAIKRMLKAFYSMADTETKLLIESDEHPNVVRYYATEDDAEFVYLALSFAHKSLDQLIDADSAVAAAASSPAPPGFAPPKSMPEAARKEILLQLARGIQHLHHLNIVHRDIKPQNVLVVHAPAGIQVKISDMGLAKKLELERNSFSTTAHGTVGWQAPEVLVRRKNAPGEGSSGSASSSSSDGDKSPSDTPDTDRAKMTKKVDIFALGCLFYYVLTGQHPFGDKISREVNVLNGNFKIASIGPEAYDLVSSMIDADPMKRPTAENILVHPYFWNGEKKLNFIRDASDFLEREQPTAPVVLEFEHGANKAEVIPGRDWIPLLSKLLLTDLNKFRKYNSSKLRDLLRIIRNKAHHYRDLPLELQQALGGIPDGYLQYFMTRFPKLFNYTYNFVKERCETDQKLQPYFTLPDPAV